MGAELAAQATRARAAAAAVAAAEAALSAAGLELGLDPAAWGFLGPAATLGTLAQGQGGSGQSYLVSMASPPPHSQLLQGAYPAASRTPATPTHTGPASQASPAAATLGPAAAPGCTPPPPPRGQQEQPQHAVAAWALPGEEDGGGGEGGARGGIGGAVPSTPSFRAGTAGPGPSRSALLLSPPPRLRLSPAADDGDGHAGPHSQGGRPGAGAAPAGGTQGGTGAEPAGFGTVVTWGPAGSSPGGPPSPSPTRAHQQQRPGSPRSPTRGGGGGSSGGSSPLRRSASVSSPRAVTRLGTMGRAAGTLVYVDDSDEEGVEEQGEGKEGGQGSAAAAAGGTVDATAYVQHPGAAAAALEHTHPAPAPALRWTNPAVRHHNPPGADWGAWREVRAPPLPVPSLAFGGGALPPGARWQRSLLTNREARVVVTET